MPDTLIPQQLLKQAHRILFITHLAIGDFAYLQNHFQAFAQAYPHLKIDLWVDEVRRTWNPKLWPYLERYILYDWLQHCSFFHKIYQQTYSPALYQQSIREAQQQDYPIIVSLATLRPHHYANLAKKINPQSYIISTKKSFHFWQFSRYFAYRQIQILSTQKLIKGQHISACYADWFHQLGDIYLSKEQCFPFVNIPKQVIQNAQSQLMQWNFSSNKLLIFINAFAKSKKRCWPLNSVITLIGFIQRQKQWEHAGFIINTTPEKNLAVQKIIKKHALKNTQLFSAYNSFFELPAILSQCHLIISVETSVMHLANAVSVPLIALMRQKNPEWAPIDTQHSRIITTAKRSDAIKAISAQQVYIVVSQLI